MVSMCALGTLRHECRALREARRLPRYWICALGERRPTLIRAQRGDLAHKVGGSGILVHFMLLNADEIDDDQLCCEMGR